MGSPFLDTPESEWIASNELAFAIFDAYPVTPGHALVVTRRVVPTWWEATRLERLAIVDLIDLVRRHLDAEFGPLGFNVGFNAGEAAGQTVPHLRAHRRPAHLLGEPGPAGRRRSFSEVGRL